MTAAPAFLTVRELADLLRVKERKVYQLAADGEVPCRRVTGKLLFPRDEIEAWIGGGDDSAGVPEVSGMRPAIVAGSHDPLLDWAIRESGAALPTLFDGSLDGLHRFQRREVSVAAIHIPEAAGVRWNLDAVDALGPRRDAVLISWARRSRGLIVAAGNPLGIATVTDLEGRRVIPRQDMAGSQILLRQLLDESGLGEADIRRIDPPARTESEVAEAVHAGRADCGLGLAAAAGQSDLGFVPLVEEEFDLLVCRKFYFERPFQSLLDFARSALFRVRAEELGGYDISGLGRIRDNAP
ncbi:helix-turn-helix transcriptional regulator [Nisaea acidiphila]|uniref:Helix-turn-helix transcriptional regulator n=1 Tax=Nisaea acidiphila TaxID=1862145 RepID=A0A9J7AZ06_9PROT|nr:helix-turn-helix transcriptional regulator [Nisaea acidiphila]UUX52018.1 helix-turn-helix transcriptional regulator [Nisaea acidiphila]